MTTETPVLTRESIRDLAIEASAYVSRLSSLLSVLEHATFNGSGPIENYLSDVLIIARDMADDATNKIGKIEVDVRKVGEVAQ